MSNFKKVVTFFNISSEDVIPYAAPLLEPPNSVPIQVATSIDGRFHSQVIDATENKTSLSGYEINGRENTKMYSKLLSISRTLVLSQSVFTDDERSNASFRKHGLQQTREFYENGGRIVVLGSNGNPDISMHLTSHFGCQWCFGKTCKRGECVPTKEGRSFLGPSITLEEDRVEKGHFMITPKDEGLFQMKILSEEEYFTGNNYDEAFLSSDEDLDDDEVEEFHEVYSQYVNENSQLFLIAMHKHQSGGQLVWIGYRDTDTSNKKMMRSAFAQICCC